MSYKDPDKQREANRQAKRKQRAKKTYDMAVELGMTPKGMTNEDNVIPKSDIPVIPKQGETEGWINNIWTSTKPESTKRGKAIKCFADLPTDVKMAIDMLSKNEAERKNRTAIALNYQHQLTGIA